MSRKLVIDTSIYFSYAFHGKIYRLVNAILQYQLTVYVNAELNAELLRNIPRALKKTGADPASVIELIMAVTLYTETRPVFSASPDPKDNFLFDLALQTGSEAIVTLENALLQFSGCPVPVYSLKWFKETFPVAL